MSRKPLLRCIDQFLQSSGCVPDADDLHEIRAVHVVDQGARKVPYRMEAQRVGQVGEQVGVSCRSDGRVVAKQGESAVDGVEEVVGRGRADMGVEPVGDVVENECAKTGARARLAPNSVVVLPAQSLTPWVCMVCRGRQQPAGA